MSNISAKTQQGNNWSVFLGLVLEDKEPGSKDIKVHLEELIPFVEGEVNPKKMELQVSSDYSEKTYSGTVEASNFVTATYLGTESNRRYPPDVRKNEQVFVFNYSDQDKYFWISSGRDDVLRRVERYNISVSDLSSTSVDQLTDDNTYFFELDTRYNKRVMISTSNSDGEAYKYTFLIDTKDSVVSLCDNNDNEIQIDSKVPRVMMRNNSGSLIDLAQENISIVAPKELLIKVGSRGVIEIPSILIKNAGGQGTEWETASFSLHGSGNCVINFPAVGINKLVRLQSVVTGPLQASVLNLGTPGSPFKAVSIPTTNGYNPATNNPNISLSDAAELAKKADAVADDPYQQITSAITRAVSVMNNGISMSPRGITSPLYGELTTPGENTGMYHIWKALHLLADACDTLAQFHSIDLTGQYTDPAREHADIAYKGPYVA